MDDPINEWPNKSIKAHRKAVYCTQFNCNGELLATGSADQTIKVWKIDDALSGKTEAELRGHADAVTNLAWHPTSPHRLASISSSGDRSVRFWDSRLGKSTATLDLFAGNLYLAWSPDGESLAVGNKQDVVSIIDTRKLTVSNKFSYKQQVNALSWSPEGELFFQATGSAVEVFRWPGMKRCASMAGHTAPVMSLAFDPSHKYIVTGGMDALVCLWDAEELICLRTFYKIDQPVRALGFSHDSKYLAICGEESTVDVENLESGVSLGRLVLSRAPEDCSWHPRKVLLVHGGDVGGSYDGSFASIVFRWQK